MKKRLTLAFVFVAAFSQAQITIPNGAILAASDGAEITINAKGNVTNSSSYDFSNTNLRLTFQANAVAQTISGNLAVSSLTLLAGTNTNVSGNLTIANEIYFNSGLLTPTGTGKILYTGSADNINGDESGRFDDSFVAGIFHVRSGDRNFFPVGGTAFGYAPVWLESGNGTDEIGVEVIDGDVALTYELTGELQAMDNTHYWEISAPDLAALNTRVSVADIEPFRSDLANVIVQSESTGGAAENLLGITDGSVITSRKKVTKPIIAIGGSVEVELVIYDIITPFMEDGVNDDLYVQNIDKFLVNTVTLLDRWGAPVKEWKNFSNYNDPLNPNLDGYDFKKLSPGSYICIVEYGDEESGFNKKSQMVTVLKAK
jgi:hypothetical protein